ncbi:hypothetical protein HYZ76_02000, partial [Candidatus Falkowbacteria bacterium]|nr:hypothetical protein [Candidatus Falkowbacteria bacterium]
MRVKMENLVAKSKEIILNSSLENGAIVASWDEDNCYVWPRDAAYACVAASLVGVKTIQEPFFAWLESQPEDFKKQGRLYGNYSINGRIKNRQFQPDQAGTVLWAIYEFYKNNTKELPKQKILIKRLA